MLIQLYNVCARMHVLVSQKRSHTDIPMLLDRVSFESLSEFLACGRFKTQFWIDKTTSCTYRISCPSASCLLTEIDWYAFIELSMLSCIASICTFVRLQVHDWLMTLPLRRDILRHAGFEVLTRSSIVGWRTMLQAGRSLVPVPTRSLDFSIDLIPPAAL
jgi:hypothetical protein